MVAAQEAAVVWLPVVAARKLVRFRQRSIEEHQPLPRREEEWKMVVACVLKSVGQLRSRVILAAHASVASPQQVNEILTHALAEDRILRDEDLSKVFINTFPALPHHRWRSTPQHDLDLLGRILDLGQIKRFVVIFWRKHSRRRWPTGQTRHATGDRFPPVRQVVIEQPIQATCGLSGATPAQQQHRARLRQGNDLVFFGRHQKRKRGSCTLGEDGARNGRRELVELENVVAVLVRISRWGKRLQLLNRMQLFVIGWTILDKKSAVASSRDPSSRNVPLCPWAP